MTAFIEIKTEKTTVGSSGQRYRVWHGDAVLLESTKSPLYDSARALWALGADVDDTILCGPIDAPTHHISGRVGYLAARRVSETQDSGPRVETWQPYFRGADDE